MYVCMYVCIYVYMDIYIYIYIYNIIMHCNLTYIRVPYHTNPSRPIPCPAQPILSHFIPVHAYIPSATTLHTYDAHGNIMMK